MTQAITPFSFCVQPDEAGARLDVFLTQRDAPALSRSQVTRCLKSGEVTVNGRPVKAGYRLRQGDRVTWAHAPPAAPDMAPQDLALTFLYDDPHVAIVDKPAGMVVHPAPGHPDGTLVNALLHHLAGELSGVGGELRPGIVHRIDKDTSGAIAVTKTDAAHQHLAELFRHHHIQRTYHALALDQGLHERGSFDTLHGRDPRNRFRFTGGVARGKRAVTHYAILERFPQGVALVECQLETGRTHQIRMHFHDAGCALLGDTLYGGRSTQKNRLISRQALHARTLGFVHMDGTPVLATAPYPDDFASALDALRAGKSWRA